MLRSPRLSTTAQTPSSLSKQDVSPRNGQETEKGHRPRQRGAGSPVKRDAHQVSTCQCPNWRHITDSHLTPSTRIARQGDGTTRRTTVNPPHAYELLLVGWIASAHSRRHRQPTPPCRRLRHQRTAPNQWVAATHNYTARPPIALYAKGGILSPPAPPPLASLASRDLAKGRLFLTTQQLQPL
jgi:hypothetical protein